MILQSNHKGPGLKQPFILDSSNNDFYSLSEEKLFVQLQSNREGLSGAEALQRAKYFEGLSSVRRSWVTDIRLLLRQFTSPLVLLLVIAVILSSVLGESSDAFIILFILLTTGFLGFWQEWNAGRAFEKLKKMIEMKHSVLREGLLTSLTTREIVPGDILQFDAGDIIPADCRIIESNELHVDESTLTGESYPVEKISGELKPGLPLRQRINCLWQGTSVISGTAVAIAVRTGSQTEFGQMAHSLEKHVDTAFEKGIKRFGFFLLRITIVLSLIILIANLYFHKPLFDAVLFSLALAVGMAPELLPAIMTFTMAAGSRRMMKKKVIVKKLSSIFNFGEMNLLCTDKTGTITEGKVKVKDIVDANGDSNDRIRLLTSLNSSFQNGFENPIDNAILSLNISLAGYSKINEVPYDFNRKRLSVAVKTGMQKLIITKGAFDNVLAICSRFETVNEETRELDEAAHALLNQKYIAYSRDGYRVLALARKDLSGEKMYREDECEMIFMGYILLEDPLKADSQSSLLNLQKLFVTVKIVTGDNRYAAAHTARMLGMNEEGILTGEDIDRLSPEALVVKVKDTGIFAETEPRQKERIIRALQQSHYTVAYIGDGINDVAAINAADIGISTNNAVDVAKEAADFVFLEKDLSVLADGVYEGRKSFVNSMKYIFITTGATFGNMLSVAGASLFLPFLPMLPKQILLTNLLTDFPFLIIGSDRVDGDQLVRPGRWNLKVIRNFMIVFGLHSSIFDFLTFYGLYIYFRLSGSAFQTGWFLESAITEILIIFIVRTRKSFLTSKPGKLLLISSLVAFLVTIYLPVSPFAGILGLSIAHFKQVLFIAGLLVLYVITADLIKIQFFRKAED